MYPMVPGSTVTLERGKDGMVGLTIGGGAPYCPSLYVVQVFENTPAWKEGTLKAGDELMAVNTRSLKGMTKVQAAKFIQRIDGDVTFTYAKLTVDTNHFKEAKGLDMVMKKVKHKCIERMSSGTADKLGLTRAVLCNDDLAKKLEEFERNAKFYKEMIVRSHYLLLDFNAVCGVYKGMGDLFSQIAVREKCAANEAFTIFADTHRNYHKAGSEFQKKAAPIMNKLGTYLHKAVPDMRLTIKKYANAKFEYLAYCLKIKEMDDEEYTFNSLDDPLPRVEEGNYEYRVVLRCRAQARAYFLQLRSDVRVKLQLLNSKHVQDLTVQLEQWTKVQLAYYEEAAAISDKANVFPIDIDLSTVVDAQ
ncbi:PRKCA-binding protein-like [Bolinopsis microptera]|uniref:PRKCA-binding protein-like n=1 Tax=Bolinopsis microptera TaxID=2820187 RepID=UPI003078C25D